MKISVVMASYLGTYKGAARNRGEKLIRAVNSVINQTHKDWELIIVADGCEKTKQLYIKHFADNEKIKCLHIPKQHLWSGIVRNTGIDNATGEVICYLDSDDMFTPNHLQDVANGFGANQWVWFNDYYYNPKLKAFKIHITDVNELGLIGTSSIAHRKIGARWQNADSYGHDYNFVLDLKRKSGRYAKIPGCGYLICHIPFQMDYSGTKIDIIPH